MDNVILLADSNSPSWQFAEKIQKYIKENRQMEIPLQGVSIEFFNNKEINMAVPSNVRKKHVYFIHDSSKNPQQWWIELLLIKDLLLSASVKSLSFVLPNMFYSRQDRKHKSRVPISSRAFANSISSGLSRVITMDLHAPQIQNAYPPQVPLDNLYSFPEVVRYFNENFMKEINKLVVVSPDAGGVERARSFLKRIEKLNRDSDKEFSLAVINKIRSKPGEIDSMHLLGDVEGKDVLVIDDIIDTGGTLCKAAEILREKGAKRVFCYATHGIFTKGAKELKEKFDVIFVSNTTLNPEMNSEKIEVIDVSETFAEAIYRAQKGLSVSELFE